MIAAAAADIAETMTKPRTTLALAVLAAALAPAPALAAGPTAGAWEGKIAHQGYEITFTVKNGKMTKVAARMLVDCDRDGFSETMTLAPSGAFAIRDGRVKATREDRYDDAVAHYELDVRFVGRKATGSIREYDTVDGVGVVCDTLKREFTAKRG